MAKKHRGRKTKKKKPKTFTKHKQYRGKLGRFTKKPGKVARKRPRRISRVEGYEYRRGSGGRFTLGRKYQAYGFITKQIDQIDLNNWNGNIRDALESSNLISSMIDTRALGVEITVSGWKVSRGRRIKVTIKRSFDLANILARSAIEGLTVGAIIRDLHALGLRTQYRLETVTDWTHKETRKKDAARYAELQNVKISAKVYRG